MTHYYGTLLFLLSSFVPGYVAFSIFPRQYLNTNGNNGLISTSATAVPDNSQNFTATTGLPYNFTTPGLLNNFTTIQGLTDNFTTISGLLYNFTTIQGLPDNFSLISGLFDNFTTISELPDNFTTISGLLHNFTTISGLLDNFTTISGLSDNFTMIQGLLDNFTTIFGSPENFTTTLGLPENFTTISGVIGNFTASPELLADFTATLGLFNNFTTTSGLPDNFTATSELLDNFTTTSKLPENFTTTLSDSSQSFTSTSFGNEYTTIQDSSSDYQTTITTTTDDDDDDGDDSVDESDGDDTNDDDSNSNESSEYLIEGPGFSEVDRHEFPFIVAIVYNGKYQGCGGALIYTNVVLTSAHCVDQLERQVLSPARVIIGGRNVKEEVSESGLSILNLPIRRMIKHPKYQDHDGHQKGNVGLIFLEDPSRKQNKIKLTKHVVDRTIKMAHKCYYAGYSTLKDGRPHKFTESIQLDKNCQNYTRFLSTAGADWFDPSQEFCLLRDDNTSICKEDGFPFFCDPDGQGFFEVYGVGSWSTCKEGHPARDSFFSKVGLFRSWILNEIEKDWVASGAPEKY